MDRLPKELKAVVDAMLIDDQWPSDFPASARFGFNASSTEPQGMPRYEDVVAYCATRGFRLSLSAVGRYGVRVRTLARMRRAGQIARDVMADLTAENASATQKAAAEMITAQVIDLVSRDETLDAKELKHIGQAVRDCAQVAIKADTYIRQQLSARVQTLADGTAKKLAASGIDRAKIQEIIDDILGVTQTGGPK